MSSLDDGQLRRLDLERFVFTRATVLVLRGHRIADDPDRRVVGDRPFGDPELALRLFFVGAIAHRDVNGLAGVVQGDDELWGFLTIACLGVRYEHPEADGFAALEAVPQETVFRMARRLEHSHV